jgi:hypothetical protein
VEGLVWRENKVAAVLHAALAKKVAGQVYDPLTATQVRCAAQCNHDDLIAVLSDGGLSEGVAAVKQ